MLLAINVDDKYKDILDYLVVPVVSYRYVNGCKEYILQKDIFASEFLNVIYVCLSIDSDDIPSLEIYEKEFETKLTVIDVLSVDVVNEYPTFLDKVL